jgi:hypothetical protein
MVPPPHNTSEYDFAALIAQLAAKYRVSPEDARSIEQAFRAAMEYAQSLGAQSRQAEVGRLKDGLLTCKRTLERADPGLVRDLQVDPMVTLLQYVDWALDTAAPSADSDSEPRTLGSKLARFGAQFFGRR